MGQGNGFGESVRGVSADHERLLCDRPRSSPRDGPQYNVVTSTWVVDRSDDLHPFHRFSGATYVEDFWSAVRSEGSAYRLLRGERVTCAEEEQGERRQGNQPRAGAERPRPLYGQS